MDNFTIRGKAKTVFKIIKLMAKEEDAKAKGKGK